MLKPKKNLTIQGLSRTARIRLLFWVLVTGTALYIVYHIIIPITIKQNIEFWTGYLDNRWRTGEPLTDLLRTGLFQFFLLALGWVALIRLRSREIGQLRLRRSEQKYRSIINHATEAIFLLDSAGRVMEWNKAAEQIFGIPRRNALAQRIEDLDLGLQPSLTGIISQARRMRKRAFSEFHLSREGGFAQLGVAVSTIEPGTGEKAEQIGSHVVFVRDITSEKQIETRMSETEKMAGIGQLAAGIAHQLNTPLGSILLSAQMLEEDVEDEDQAEDIRRIIRQTEQCRRIIKGLLNFARPTGSERGRLNLGEVVRETTYLMEKTLKVATIEVAIEEEERSWVNGNRNELEQVFFNLLANAMDAMPHGGNIAVRIGRVVPGEIQVEFTDQGEGIATEHHDRIFLPFFTTKDYGKGTGLGLSIVARIIHEHGGHVEMRSKPGQGTTFTLTLPSARDDDTPDEVIL
ncbi:hypothetical protein COW53_08435 [bacterium CG17_big_fil_post_rev_8_21_14_2_50_64_8]|nr:MAG: hypothetical protein COW53_08435 [bacterium CG17_big_fil_post_rev_8_21_14_2_50_64_8]PJA75827.1 MAG: hypothetical protein CO151_04685 [bacterium CG_4_9_14_3_um_filter_65_15]